MKDVYIFSTDPSSVQGGISTSVATILIGLNSRGVSTKVFTTHYPSQKKPANSVSFLLSLIHLIFDLTKVKLQGRQLPIIYLHVGPAGSLIRKLIIAYISYFLGANVFAHHHSAVFERYLAEGNLYGRLLIKLCKISKENLVLSDWWANLYRLHGISNIRTVPNSIPIPEKYSHLTCVDKGKKIFSIGRLVKEKNIHLVIESLPYLPNVSKLIIAGDGPARNELSNLAIQLGVSKKVDFLGWVDAMQKKDLYRAVDLTVVPSEYDSFGMVFIESLSFGCPVVTGPNPPVKAALDGLAGVFTASAYTASDTVCAIEHALTETVNRHQISESCLSVYSTDAISDKLISALGLSDTQN